MEDDMAMVLPGLRCPRCGGAGYIPDGRGLVAVRNRLGLTQTALAKKLGVTPQYLHAVEIGLKPLATQHAKKLATLYGGMDWTTTHKTRRKA